jgi:carbonic anhydrase
MRTHKELTRQNLTPLKAIEVLKEGNFRFVTALNMDHDHLQVINETKDGQWPYAAIVSCMDSRTSAELIFDQGLGDIFSIRLAGNVISENVLGSLEYACKVAGSKLIVVLGHTKCGAIKGACDNVEMGNLTGLLHKIRPAVEGENTITENRTSSNADFVNKVTHLHVQNCVQDILAGSPILKEMVSKGEIGLVPATYDIETGVVHFHPEGRYVREQEADKAVIASSNGIAH